MKFTVKGIEAIQSFVEGNAVAQRALQAWIDACYGESDPPRLHLDTISFSGDQVEAENDHD